MPTYFDASQLIDLGTAPNANDGDTLRTAGSKINTALQDIDSALDALDSDFRVAFDSSQIGTDAISTVKIQDGAVNSAKLTPGSLSNTVYAGSLNFDSTAANDIITINAARRPRGCGSGRRSGRPRSELDSWRPRPSALPSLRPRRISIDFTLKI